LKEGERDYPEIKEKVSEHYTGKLLDGKVFDTSHGEVAKKADFLMKAGHINHTSSLWEQEV